MRTVLIALLTAASVGVTTMSAKNLSDYYNIKCQRAEQQQLSALIQTINPTKNVTRVLKNRSAPRRHRVIKAAVQWEI